LLARLDESRLLLLITGMGAAATERALAWALRETNPLGRPARVVCAGFCGALVDGLEVGALLQPDEVVAGRGTDWQSVLPLMVGRIANPSSPLRGRLVTVQHPVLRRQARRELHQRCGAVAVDMESFTAVRLCRQAGVPLLCLRAVSDTAEASFPAALATALQGEKVHLFRLALAVLRRPWLVRNLIQLAQQSRLAAEALSLELQQLLRAGIRSRLLSER
jgi:adenosylhomocysteine nucleosidase